MMEIRSASNPRDMKHYITDRLREKFHITGLFTEDQCKMVYSHIDRIITAGFMPVTKELKLEAGKELAAEYFLGRSTAVSAQRIIPLSGQCAEKIRNLTIWTLLKQRI